MSASVPGEPPTSRHENALQPGPSRYWMPAPDSYTAANYTGNYISGDGRAHLGNIYNYYGTAPTVPGPGGAHSSEATRSAPTSRTTYQVPFSLDGIPVAPEFIAREDEIKELESIFLEPDVQGRKVCIVHGLGGIGKTQLCIYFARKHFRRFTAVIWLDASSKDALEQSMERCLERILRSNSSYQGLVRTGQGPSTESEDTEHTAIWRLKAWLSEDANHRWLLVFDNLDRDWRSGNDPLAFDYFHYLPPADHGSILINSRISTLQAQHRRKLGPTSRDGALKMLQSRAGRSIQDANSILDKLGDLPLAIVQAGSFLGQHNMSASNYLALYKSKWDELMETQNDNRSSEYGERSILTTWVISRDHAAGRDPNAAGLLRIWAYLDSREIWYELINSARYAGHDSEHPQWYYDLTSHVLAFQKAIGVLLNYSLVEVNDNGLSWAMHPVLHSWNRHSVVKGNDPEVSLRIALAAVSKTCDDTKSASRLLPHAQALVEDIGHVEGNFAGVHLARIACLLSEHKMFAESQKVFERALGLRRLHLQPGDLWTLTTMSRLGKVYATQGELDQAHAIFEKALAECEERYGKDHWYGLGIMAYLGRTCQDKEDFQASEKWFCRALDFAKHSAAFGPHHTVTISFYDDLGGVYCAASRFDDAEAMYLQALRGREAVLGPNDPLTHDVVFHLGRLYHFLGRSEDAEAMYSRAYHGRAMRFGLNSRLTQNTLRSLGTVFIEDSEYDQAEQLYLSAQSQAVVRYGKHDPSTLFVCKELGLLYEEQQLYPKAEKMYKQVIRGYQKTVGMNHGDTLDAERHFAVFLTQSGRLKLALQLLLKCKEHYEFSDPDGDHTTTSQWIELVEERLEFCRNQNISEERLIEAVQRYGPLSQENWPYIKRQLCPDMTSDSESDVEPRRGTRRGPNRVVRFEGSESSVSGGLSENDRFSDVESLPAAPEHDNNEPILTYEEFVAESNVATVAHQPRQTINRPRFQAYAESLSTESLEDYRPPVVETQQTSEPLGDEQHEQDPSEAPHEAQSGVRTGPANVESSESEPSESGSGDLENEEEIDEVQPNYASYRETSVLDWLATTDDAVPTLPDAAINNPIGDLIQDARNDARPDELVMVGAEDDMVEHTTELPVTGGTPLSNVHQSNEVHDGVAYTTEMLSTLTESSVDSQSTEDANEAVSYEPSIDLTREPTIEIPRDEHISEPTGNIEDDQTAEMPDAGDHSNSNADESQEAPEDITTRTAALSSSITSSVDSEASQNSNQDIGLERPLTEDWINHVQEDSFSSAPDAKIVAGTGIGRNEEIHKVEPKPEVRNTKGSKPGQKRTSAGARQNTSQTKKSPRSQKSHTRRRSSQKQSTCVIQ